MSRSEIHSRPDVSLIQLTDFGKSIRLYNLNGPICAKIPVILTNIAHCDHDLILIPSGLTELSEEDRLGGDSNLSMKGRSYSNKVNALLGSLMNEADLVQPKKVFFSKERRSIQTKGHLTVLKEAKEEEVFFLHGVNYGKYDGCLSKDLPDSARPEKQPFPMRTLFRFPDGESIEDIIERIDPLIL